MAYSARLLSTTQLQKLVHQVAHGFVVGDLLRLNAGTYVKAKADSEANAALVGMVSSVTGADDFYIAQEGYLSGLAGLAAGTVYYLDPVTAGALTAAKPVAVGQVELPCFIADSATTGYFFTSVGDLIIPSGTLFPYSVVAVNTAMTVNNGYITNSAGLLTMTIPGAFAVSDRITVSGHGAGGWTIAQPAGVQIFDLAGNSTIGVGGSVSSTGNGDVIDMVCVVANTSFRVVSSKGTLSYV